jgi:hypothetical protein
MNKESSNERAALDRLADALAEDILQATDADLLAEAEADRDDGAVRARTAFRRAALLSRRTATTEAWRRALPNVRALDPGTARRRLQEYIASDPGAASEFTPGTCDADELSDEAVYVALESLQRRSSPEHRDRSPEGR